MILCQTCGDDIPILRSVAVVGRLLIPDHTCRRYLVAECWDAGRCVVRWTSQEPGTTGPHGLVRWHRDKADAGWQPPNGPLGWSYGWVEVAA